MTTDSADRALSQPSPETSATGALTDIQLWELLPKRLEQNLLAMVQIAAPHHNLKPIDLLQNIAPDFVDYARAVLKAKPQAERPSEKDLYDLAAEFNGDPVPAMRRALELWGNLVQGAPAPGENPATQPALEPPSPSGYAYRYRSPFGSTYIRFNGGEKVNGGRPIEAVPYWFAPPSAPATPPAPVPETPAETLAARPLLERVAQLGDVIGQQTVAQVQQLANQAAAWLRENPPGQPVAIEPRGCPTPGACSCVGPTPPAPVLGDAACPTFLDAIRLAQGCHDYSGGHSGTEGEAWHGAIDTVVGVLKRAAVGPWDSQLTAVAQIVKSVGWICCPALITKTVPPSQRFRLGR